MEAFESRLEKVYALITAIRDNRDRLVEIAVKDTGFTYRECNMEVDGILRDLKDFKIMAEAFALRRPICEGGQAVALVSTGGGPTSLECCRLIRLGRPRPEPCLERGRSWVAPRQRG